MKIFRVVKFLMLVLLQDAKDNRRKENNHK